MNFSKKEPQQIEKKNKYRLRAHYWSGKVPVCIIYPNTHYLGMSNLGFQTIYQLFSSDSRFAADRLFYPGSIKVYEPVSHTAEYKLRDFFVLAFSISYENDYLNVLKILNKGGIEIDRRKRGDSFPLLIAGGAAITINPGALSMVMDAFFIGEVEDAFSEISDKIVKTYEKRIKKGYLLNELVEIEGIYIPEFYHYERDKNGKVSAIAPKNNEPTKIKRRITRDINRFIPRTFLFTSETEFKNIGIIEISRGCKWKCRFCAASYIYNPPRFRSMDVLKEEFISMSGACSKFGLLGALPTDHPDLLKLTNFLLSINRKFSFSSIRVGALNDSIITNLKSGGERTITLAPETGSERLRKIINKPITNKAIFSQIDRIVRNGLRRVKLYFLIGLPFESDEDIYCLAKLVNELIKIFPEVFLTLSIGIFVPKPHTPFQYAGLVTREIINRRIKILKNELSFKKNLNLEITSFKTTILETVLTHGDAGLSEKLIELVKSGNINRLLKIIDSNHIFNEKEIKEFFFWDIIDDGMDRSFLLSEYKHAVSS